MPDGRRLSDEELAIDAHRQARVVSPVRVEWRHLGPDQRSALVGLVRQYRLKWYLEGEAAVVDDLWRAVAPRMRVFLWQIAKRLREEAQREIN
jgi:hypothetical protein